MGNPMCVNSKLQFTAEEQHESFGGHPAPDCLPANLQGALLRCASQEVTVDAGLRYGGAPSPAWSAITTEEVTDLQRYGLAYIRWSPTHASQKQLYPTDEGFRRIIATLSTHLPDAIPNGRPGYANAIPVTVSCTALQAILFGGAPYRIDLFLPGHRYSRKTLFIDATGAVSEDVSGVIPTFDRAEREPTFGQLTLAEIAFAVLQQIDAAGAFVAGAESARETNWLTLLAHLALAGTQQRRVVSARTTRAAAEVFATELPLCDPYSGGEHGDYASAVVITMSITEGPIHLDTLIASVLAAEQDRKRVELTIDRMIEAGFLFRDGVMISNNTELVRG